MMKIESEDKQINFSQTQQDIIKNVKKEEYKKHLKKIKNEQMKRLMDNCFQSCVHILQDFFGSGFCISKDGLIITCAHCVYDKDDEELNGKQHLKLIFPTGEIYTSKVIFFDENLDCALLQIIDAPQDKIFNFVQISYQNAKNKENIFCIGQPAYENLETKKFEKTNYPPFYLSEGQVDGYLKNKTYVNTSNELGPLKHSCWTYWGHSGAPLFNQDGQVIGMHNSWNPKNAQRHGMSADSINLFMEIYNKQLKDK